MTAPLVYSDTGKVMPPRQGDIHFPYLGDGDRRAKKRWPIVKGQLWERLAERAAR